MSNNPNELININDAKHMLRSEGLTHLSHIICCGRTVNIGKRMFISKKQLDNCLKKDAISVAFCQRHAPLGQF